MWVITTKGFFSAVQHRDDPTRVLVRARVKQDIDALAEYLPDSKPFRMNYSDYEWRLECSAVEWASVLMEFAMEIDYPNFKSAVAKRQGSARSRVYMSVWSVLLRLEPFGRYSERWDDPGTRRSRKPRGKKAKKGKARKS